MSNSFYNASGTPGTGQFGASSPVRSEFLAIQAGFDKMPALSSGVAGCAIVVNGGGNGLTNTAGTLVLGAAFATAGGFGTTLVEQATVSLTLPATNGTLLIAGGSLGTPASGTLTNCTGLPVSTGLAGLGTGVAAALGVAIGSAGAPVVLGGALGTPSSGTLTNCTTATATVGDNTTKPASTAFVQAALTPKIAFSAYLNSATQSLTNSTPTKIQLNAKEFDVGGFFDATTNFRYQPTVSGYYHFNWRADMGTTGAGNLVIASLYKNGTLFKRGNTITSGTSGSSNNPVGTALVYLNGSTDYAEFWVDQVTGGSLNVQGSDVSTTFLQGFLIFPA